MQNISGFSVEEISLHDDDIIRCCHYDRDAVAMVDAAFDDLHCMIRVRHTVTTCTSCMNCESCFGRRGPSAQ